MQSDQTGITPLWPPSGIALFFLFRFGLRYWPGILFGMLGLAQWAEIPVQAALMAAVGSILEAVVPILVLRRFAFFGELVSLAEVLSFIGVAALLGPLLSASIGSVAFVLFADIARPPLTIWLNWWLGNSLGIMVIGTFLLVWHQNLPRSVPLLLTVALVVGLICAFSAWLAHTYLSPMALFFITPLTVLVALHCGIHGVTFVNLTAALSWLAIGAWFRGATIGAGADGILLLDFSFLWGNGFTGLVVAAALNERATAAQLHFQAHHDALTGLLNRGAFSGLLEKAIADAHKAGERHALAYLDLDGLKRVNDELGHAAGDQVLVALAETLTSQTRVCDSVGRLGGDEFGILLRHCDLKRAGVITETLRSAVAETPIRWRDRQLTVTGSFGVAAIGEGTRGVEELVEAADKASYRVKRSGKNGVAEAED